jgi:multimeric flavodoxin WrbA
MKLLLICGSRTIAGQTARAAEAFLEGASKAGSEAERIFLPALRIERCRQCEDNGWGLCRREGTCVIQDDFAAVADQVRSAQVIIFATPVYYSDLSESLRAFLDRLRRTCTVEAGRQGIAHKPAYGICVAGGGGGGAPACCLSLEKALATCGFDVVDLLAVRRQNLSLKLAQLALSGQWAVKQGAPRTDGTL